MRELSILRLKCLGLRKSSLVTFCRLVSAILAVSTLIIGCSKRSNDGPEGRPPKSLKKYSVAELNQIITTGMPAEDVTNAFGVPGTANRISESAVLLTYRFPHTSGEEALHVAGFSIVLQAGRVTQWSPIHQKSVRRKPPAGVGGSKGNKTIQLFVATDNRSPLVDAVRLQGYAAASELNGSADLTFSAKMFAGDAETKRPGEKTVILLLDSLDASKLRNLTETNVGRRLLVVCKSNVIAAPLISAPFVGGQVQFTAKGSAALDALLAE